MLFQITVKFCGSAIKTVAIKAECALSAINKVEAGYKSRTVSLSTKNGNVSTFSWTGFEFEAREVETLDNTYRMGKPAMPETMGVLS